MWKTCYQNRICYTQDQSREQNQHLERLFCIRPQTNTESPYKPTFLKEREIHQKVKRENIENKINYENQLLDKKLVDIIFKDGQYSKNVLEPKRCPAFDRFYNHKYENLITTINNGNRILYTKIGTLKPNYSRIEMSKEAGKQEKYLSNILKRPRSIPYRPALNFLSIEQIKSRLEKQFANNLLFYEQQQQLKTQQNNKSKTSRKGSSIKKNGTSRKNTEGGDGGKNLNRSHRSQSSKNRKSLKINEEGEIEENGKKKSSKNKENESSGVNTCAMGGNKKENATTKATTNKKNN